VDLMACLVLPFPALAPLKVSNARLIAPVPRTADAAQLAANELVSDIFLSRISCID